ncbi:MAG TPA: hypothetical protein VEO54_03700 [Thermoanaerobaculia bacterium]|nr:hypothetical protein [Thermoanaerobaculia bacterium]
MNRDGQTTVPEEVREALHLEDGDTLTWKVQGRTAAVTTERPALWKWEGFIKVGSGDVVKDLEEARKTMGRI